MGRSGTSMITSGLPSLGVELGSNLMRADPILNPKGFFEDDEIRVLNNKIIGLYGGHFTSAAIPPEDFWLRSDLQPYRVLAQKILSQRISKFQCFGIKDPAMALVLRLWQDIFISSSVVDQYIVVVRNPISVIKSFSRFHHVDPRKIPLIWLERYVSCLSRVWDRSCVVVDYDRVVVNPREQFMRIAKRLNLAWDNKVESRVDSFAREMIDSTLRHAVDSPEILRANADTPMIVAQSYEILAKLAADQVSLADKAMRDTWLGIEQVVGEFRPFFNFLEARDAELWALRPLSLFRNIWFRRLRVLRKALAGDVNSRALLRASLHHRTFGGPGSHGDKRFKDMDRE